MENLAIFMKISQKHLGGGWEDIDIFLNILEKYLGVG